MEFTEHKVKGDRLSSLSDDILIEILSRLPIDSAVSTSILSHRWHHLWTGVTRLELDSDTLPKLSYILHHLSSPKLDIFKAEFSRIDTNWREHTDEVESCIRDICRRKVQQFILIDLTYPYSYGYDIHYSIPDCLPSCRSLVNLDLYGPFSIDYENKFVEIQLPNLKNLSLRGLTRLPNWLGYLYKSSPLLQHLTLKCVGLRLVQPLNEMPSLNLFFPNLNSLELALFPMKLSPSVHPILLIDAPKLESLVTSGCVLRYKFRTNPTALVKADIDLVRYGFPKDGDDDDETELYGLSGFFKGVSSVSNLKLKVMRWQMNIFAYINKNHGMFFNNNLVRLEVIMSQFGSVKGSEDLLVSMQCFPNLEHLRVFLINETSEEGNWSTPDIVPSCIISKIKTIEIEGTKGKDDGWLEFLRYILGNAEVLQKLFVSLDNFSEQVEHNFCKSLLKLPRKSRTCEVMFAGLYWIIK